MLFISCKNIDEKKEKLSVSSDGIKQTDTISINKSEGFVLRKVVNSAYQSPSPISVYESVNENSKLFYSNTEYGILTVP